MAIRQLALVLCGLFFNLVVAGAANAASISISCGAVGQELELCKQGAEAWAIKTGNTVTLVSTPKSTTERLALYQQLLAAGAPDIDVFQIDVIWPGILAQHFIDLKKAAGTAANAHFPAIIKNNSVAGKLVAMPWFTDAGLLYYRKDLLGKYRAKVPETWHALAATARTIQDGERQAGNDRMWGYVWQGRAYEGLTCNALEWVASHDGGTIVDPSGRVTINNAGAIAALDSAAGWVGTITPQGVLNYTEEEARGIFQSGNAVFMRNWPYAWALANSAGSPVNGKVGIAALPKGAPNGRHTATLGGYQLAVSRYSRNQDAATDLVLYLTGAAEQKRRAVAGAFLPTITGLYQDPDVLAAQPFFGSLYDTFVNAVPRPSSATGARYNQVSNAFFNATYDVLAGKSDAAGSLRRLEARLRRLSRGGKW